MTVAFRRIAVAIPLPTRTAPVLSSRLSTAPHDGSPRDVVDGVLAAVGQAYSDNFGEQVRHALGPRYAGLLSADEVHDEADSSIRKGFDTYSDGAEIWGEIGGRFVIVGASVINEPDFRIRAKGMPSWFREFEKALPRARDAGHLRPHIGFAGRQGPGR